MSSSFEYFKHWQRVAEIAGIDQRDVRPYLLSRDTSLNFPILANQAIMTLKMTTNIAYVMTRFEAYTYDTSAPFPVPGVFDNGVVLDWGTGDVGGNLKNTNFSGLANSISNIDLVSVFTGGNTNDADIILAIIAINGPKVVNVVTTAYLWQIPAPKAANFQP